VDLDGRTNAYVSAVAVPGRDMRVSYQDSLEVAVQNRDGSDCSSNMARFGASTQFPQPLAAYAYRLIDKNAYSCQEPGRYYVVVERTDDGTAGSADPWQLEIRHQSEPGLAGVGPSRAPENWPSSSPQPVPDEPRQRAGGSGFSNAIGLSPGEWSARIEPGESLFYRVPVDWGQQLFSSVDLGSSGGTGQVSGALAMALYNPARGLVDTGNAVSYDGRQKTTALRPLPPVAYENRFAGRTGDKEMRFAGWYYLRISLSPEVGTAFGERPYGLTLQVNVRGAAKAGPGYAAQAPDFTVTEDDRAAALSGRGAGGAGSDLMRMVAATGLGGGTLLLLGLGAWTLFLRVGPRAARQSVPVTTPVGEGPSAQISGRYRGAPPAH
jgi:hypothetical protein